MKAVTPATNQNLLRLMSDDGAEINISQRRLCLCDQKHPEGAEVTKEHFIFS